MLKSVSRLEDHLWYPILVRRCGNNHIIEMCGKEVNAYNDSLEKPTRLYPMGCI